MDVRAKSQETQSKVMVRCTACYIDMSTTFQLEKEKKQFNVVASHATLSVYLNEDIFQYRNKIDELTEKRLLLENVDYTLTKKKKLTLFLQQERLIHVRELWLSGHCQFIVWVRLVVELECVIGVREVFLCVLFDFSVGFNPVKELRAFA